MNIVQKIAVTVPFVAGVSLSYLMMKEYGVSGFAVIPALVGFAVTFVISIPPEEA